LTPRPLLWRGTPYRLLEAIRQRGDVQLISSAALLEELADVLTRALTSARIAAVRSCCSSNRRNFSSVVASGTSSRPRSMPTNSRIAWLSYSASSSASSASVYHCCRKYMRSMRGTPIGGRPTLPLLG
jgi:hypothetical protein